MTTDADVLATAPALGPAVLIVDDDPDDVAQFERAMAGHPWRIHSASTGAEGLRRAFESHYDAIVLDYRLGDMTGTEVLLRLREAGNETPVLIQSGFGGDFVVSRALALGAVGFVAKGSASYASEIRAKLTQAVEASRANAIGSGHAANRDSLAEVERALDDLLIRGSGDIVGVGFTSTDGIRISTRFRASHGFAPESVCAMVAIAASSATYLGQGLGLARMQTMTAQFEKGRCHVASIPDYGVLFAVALPSAAAFQQIAEEVEFAARELHAILTNLGRTTASHF